MWDPAIDTLLKAAKSAYPALGKQFSFEAARKATEAKEYARARELLTAAAPGSALQRRIPGGDGGHLRARRRRQISARLLSCQDPGLPRLQSARR